MAKFALVSIAFFNKLGDAFTLADEAAQGKAKFALVSIAFFNKLGDAFTLADEAAQGKIRKECQFWENLVERWKKSSKEKDHLFQKIQPGFGLEHFLEKKLNQHINKSILRLVDMEGHVFHLVKSQSGASC
ncbi:hypothetical protein QE152_g8978 [Popillia japonica]|uniref:Uncharacterized protein n=1 Tax=Popillia japonica TaxID=7064 RepID=A0AAW1M125_POPJA